MWSYFHKNLISLVIMLISKHVLFRMMRKYLRLVIYFHLCCMDWYSWGCHLQFASYLYTLASVRQGGALLYNRGYGCTSGTFNPYSLQTKIPAKSWTNGEKFSEICTPKRRKMNFCNVAAYFCSIENISQNLCYFIYLIRKIMILRKFETLIA